MYITLPPEYQDKTEESTEAPRTDSLLDEEDAELYEALMAPSLQEPASGPVRNRVQRAMKLSNLLSPEAPKAVPMRNCSGNLVYWEAE